MTDLYRGLLQILVMRCIEQIESFRTHIRSHNSGCAKHFELDIGVAGFWNLMLETVFTLLSVIFLTAGIIVAASLAIAFYPFAAFINYGAWLLKNTRNPAPESESPVIIKTSDGQEKK